MQEQEDQDTLDGVAIIAMNIRAPGAPDIHTFWRHLLERKELLTRFAKDALDPTVPEIERNDPDYVPVRGVLDGVELFDAPFFDMSPKEAEMLDPQQRIFMEMAWQLLEEAGYDPDRFWGLIGVYAGMSNNTYFSNNLSSNAEKIAQFGPLQTMMANEKDYLCTRLSYKLNLKGPSINVYTACSTGLVAVSEAFLGLSTYQCDMALAGGISITLPQSRGYLYQEGSILSGDGHTRPFDHNAQGTVFSNGAGVVLLKRLEDALRDRDPIYAVVRGAALNNDGAQRVSFAAPSVEGQKDAITLAHASAGVDPRSLSFVETHGTATPLGDPIEFEALTRAFRTGTRDRGFCALGALKSNLGHLDAASGIAGLIKASLALHHKVLPATLHFESPNREIDLESSPFFVNAENLALDDAREPLRAGVSAFGSGGTNAHVILEAGPERPESGPCGRPRQLLVLSAKTKTALDAQAQNLKGHLQAHPDLSLPDAAYTLQLGRKAFSHRRMFVAKNVSEAIDALDTPPAGKSATRHLKDAQANRQVVFMFPGQGSQYVHMGQNLYEKEPLFRKTVDDAADILEPLLGRDIRQLMYPQPDDTKSAAALSEETFFTQPALFTVEYALAKLWLSWGVKPSATIGHSIGEFVSACLADVFSFEDALRLVATRGRLMRDLPGGGMLSVRLPANELASQLGDHVAIAAINGPRLTVLAGPNDAVDGLKEKLESQGTACRRLHTSHAFHSPMMDPVVEPFGEAVRKVPLHPPKIPFVSTVTAQWIREEEATDPHYWARHLRATVRFGDGVQTLLEEPSRILLEVGPRASAATLARQQVKDLKNQVVVSSLSDNAENNAEWDALLSAMGHLYTAGVSPDWEAFHQGEQRLRISLPSYPFERSRHWVEPQTPRETPRTTEARVAPRAAPQSPLPSTPAPTKSVPRQKALIPLIREHLEESSGLELSEFDESTTFLEMGLDSLFLTQASLALKKKFGVKVSFRRLMGDCSSLSALASFLDQELPPEVLAPEPPRPEAPSSVQASPQETAEFPSLAGTSVLERVIGEQLKILSRQLDMLRDANTTKNTRIEPPVSQQKESPRAPPKTFGPGLKIDRTQAQKLEGPRQQALLAFVKAYTQKTGASKRFTESNRKQLADPRAAAGFSPEFKELVYPIVVNRSLGARVFDLDGNEYVDVTSGFGSNLFGHRPSFVMKAIAQQLEQGIEIGPQHPLVQDVSGLMCALTGADRVAFTNTGSEAVLAATRIARTVTGRHKIVVFSGSYHGLFDEVIVRGTKQLKSRPAAPGIPPSMVENVMVLEYGDSQSLETIATHSEDIAAVLVEPVQSRNLSLQPQAYLEALRKVTQDKGIALVFDEVITGFRTHPGGAQALFGIRADLATYGKVMGGGLPIAAVGGKAAFMDSLDGGPWNFGDASVPEVGVTYFAGTFVRHPLALAASKAALEHLKAEGPALQQTLTDKTRKTAEALRACFAKAQVPITVTQFSSILKVHVSEELGCAPLFYAWLRKNGLYISEERLWFFTTAFSEADFRFVVEAVQQTLKEMQDAGFFANPSTTRAEAFPTIEHRDYPPMEGARMGRDPQGDPGWYLPDPTRQGKYLFVKPGAIA